MTTIQFSTGKYIKTPNEALHDVTVQGLAKLIDLFSTPAILSDKIKAPYFLRCQAKHRNNNSVAPEASLLIVDADKRINWQGDNSELEGSINPAPVHGCLKSYGINHFIYSSYSNGKPDSHGYPMTKWRAVIPCQYPHDRLTDCVNYIIDLLHENELFVADAKENHTYAQAWFYPSVPPERAHLFKFFSFIDGDNLSIESIPLPIVAKQEDEQVIKQALLSSKPALARCADMGKSPIDAFNAVNTIHDVLTRNDYKLDPHTKKYLSPASSTGEAGVIVQKDGEHIISYHNDVLNDGKAHDAFSCYRLLECGGDMPKALNWDSELTRQNRQKWKTENLAKKGGVK